jgi:RTX calcium-binding nonapeptide repeat (4 copies)
MSPHIDPTSPLPPRARGRIRRVTLAAIVAGTAVVAAATTPALAMTSHAGWPADQHLAMDKGRAGRHHVLVGKPGVHNYLLGGYGNDTIYGGNAGDVIWGDFHESGWPRRQTAVIHAGNGKNYIYANDTYNYVWTGRNPHTVVHAHENSGIIHCQNRHIVVYTSHHALPHYKLRGCRHISFYSVGY